jgi:hypothetical protein
MFAARLHKRIPTRPVLSVPVTRTDDDAFQCVRVRCLNLLFELGRRKTCNRLDTVTAPLFNLIFNHVINVDAGLAGGSKNVIVNLSLYLRQFGIA